MALTSINGVALSTLSAIMGQTKSGLSAINGQTIGGNAPGSPTIFWNKFTNGSGSTATSSVGPNLTLVASPTWTVGSTGSNGAVQFNGTTQGAYTASSVTYGTNIITIAFWLYWDAYAADDDLAGESSANYNSNANTFIINWNASSFSVPQLSISNGLGLYSTVTVARPSAAAWHHIGIVFDGSVNPNAISLVTVDGVSVTVTARASDKTTTTNFAANVLNLMCRSGASSPSLFGAGRLADYRIYAGALTVPQLAYLTANPQ